MPLKLGLKHMAIISTYSFNSEGKLLNYIVDKINGARLIIMLVDF